jgi:hypothetical protein
MTDVDREVADSFERMFPVQAVTADWDDVLERAGGSHGDRGSRFGWGQARAAHRLRDRHVRPVVQRPR